MARNQIYRGNPEVKQSVIFDNFSGGINTTDIDDQMLTNEFRLLRNVELLEKGRIQNRKGFANLVVFNEWLTSQVVTLPTGFYYLFHPILDEHYTFDKLKEYNSFLEFQNAFETLPINMMFMIVLRNGLNIEFHKLVMTHQKDTLVYTATLSLEKSITTTDSSKFIDLKMTGINVENYDGKYYILLNNISSEKEGIVEFFQEDGELTINVFDKENSYTPNPYEVSNIGFNLLSNNPTQQIRVDSSIVEEIRSVFLTASDNPNKVLSKIPRNGDFTLNIIYKGGIDLAKSLRVRCYVEDDFGEKTYLDLAKTMYEVNENSGLIKYKMNLRTGTNNNIFIQVDKSVANTEIPYKKEFTSLQAAVDFYKTLGTQKFILEKISNAYVNYYVPEGTNTYGYDLDTITYDSVATGAMTRNSAKLPYMVAKTSSTDLEWYADYTSLGSSYQFVVVKHSYLSTPVYKVMVLYFSPSGTPTTDWVYETVKTLTDAVETTVSDMTPNQFDNIRIKLETTAQQSYVTEVAGTAYDIAIPGQFNSLYGAKKFILDNYNTLANSGKVFRVEAYYLIGGVCYLNGSLNLSYPDSISCTSAGGEWVSSTEYDYLQLTYVEADTVHISYDFYNYNGGTSGTVTDFTKADVDLEIELLGFTNLYPVGDSNDKEIKPIDLTKAKHIIIKDRMYIYSGNTILISDLYSALDNKSFSYFPNYNYIILSLEANDSIQKIAYFRGAYLIFTKKKIFRMSGEFMTDSFSIVTINDALGCVAPDSVRSINNTLIFMSEDGLYTVKQNFYQDGLENLDKIDRQIKGIVPRGTKHESILYNEQYMLFIKDEDNNYQKTIKQYYNMQYATKTYPYVVDEYEVIPEYLLKISMDLIAIKNNQLWVYDLGYTDFAPSNATEAELENYTYKWTVITPYWTLGYPLHEKKFKNFFIKLDSDTITPVYFTIYVDKLAFSTSFEYLAKLNEHGEIEYYKITNPVDLQTTVDSETNIVVEATPTQDTFDPDLVLGDFELGRDTLNETKYQVHKVLLGGSAKGKSIALQIEQKKNSYFGLDSIGLVYKLGKMRESR